MNSLIVYFSASGTTKEIALKLKEVIGCDIFEIKPITPYTSEDLDWTDPNSRSSIEMKDKNSRPQMKEKLESIDKYDTIYIGFPVWWYTCPHIINTFLESYDFTNKSVKVFFTSGSTEESKVYFSLINEYPFIKEAKRFESTSSDEEIKKWIND